MRKTIAVLAIIVAAPLTANASESNGIGYSNVQLDYIHNNDSMDGIGASGSYELSDNFFVTGSYAQSEDSENWMGKTIDSKRTFWTLGVGYNAAIGSRTDWVSQLAFARNDASGHDVVCYQATQDAPMACKEKSWSGHARGYNLSTGVRGRITDSLTANAYAGYEDYSGYDGNWYADLNAGYNFNPTWSLEAGARVGEDDHSWKLGVRASF